MIHWNFIVMACGLVTGLFGHKFFPVMRQHSAAWIAKRQVLGTKEKALELKLHSFKIVHVGLDVWEHGTKIMIIVQFILQNFSLDGTSFIVLALVFLLSVANTILLLDNVKQVGELALTVIHMVLKVKFDE